MLYKCLPAKSENVSKQMRGNRSRDTRPELALRKALRTAGEPGYRLHWKLPGKPDIAYPGRRVAVFMHGCYWHSCPVCAKRVSESNAEYWAAKLQYNKDRDALNQEKITQLGWTVIIVWECEVKKNLSEATRRVTEALRLAKAGKRERDSAF